MSTKPTTPGEQEKVPKRIYIDLGESLGGGLTKYAGYWYRKRFHETDIEYTRAAPADDALAIMTMVCQRLVNIEQPNPKQRCGYCQQKKHSPFCIVAAARDALKLLEPKEKQ